MRAVLLLALLAPLAAYAGPSPSLQPNTVLGSLNFTAEAATMGKYGVHSTLVVAEGSVWRVEQGKNIMPHLTTKAIHILGPKRQPSHCPVPHEACRQQC